jgi:hypothetical protein
MKSKFLIITFIVVLLCSAFNVALTMALCPTCNGKGEIPCPVCDGTGKVVDEGGACGYCSGYGTLTPTITLKSTSARPAAGEIVIQVRFENEESAAAYGKVTAEVEADSVTYTATSSRTSFPPNEEIEVTVTISGISDADYDKLVETVIIGGSGSTAEKLRVSPQVSLSEVEDINCPQCDGTGLGSSESDCARCDGTGFIDCPTCSAATTQQNGGELDISGTVYGVAAVVVVAGVAIGAFVVLKKRTVKEGDLRKLQPDEFQNWVLKRISGKSSSQSDARMGIDGYTLDGQPVSIKQADNVGRSVIENFAVAMGRHKSKNGTIVAFSFDNDAVRGRVRARMAYGLEIQMVTVRELIEGRTIAA